LRTFQTDITTTIRIAELVEDKRTLVSESGISKRYDVLRLQQAGVNTILIGEALLRCDKIAKKMQELFSISHDQNNS